MEKNTQESEHIKSSDELALDRTNLAYDRTALANNRTLMAWVRTATSLTSFGFTIYKFFSDFVSKNNELIASERLVKPRDVGMILIFFGILGLFFGLLEYHNDMKSIRSSYKGAKLISFTPILAILMLIFSLVLFITTIFRQ